MKLLKAIYWYIFKYSPDPVMRYSLRQAEGMAGIVICVFLGASYFLAQGLVVGNKPQIWACGLVVLLTLLPLFIFSMLLLGHYNEYKSSS